MIMGRYSIPVWQMIVQTINSDSLSKKYLTIPEINKLVRENFSDDLFDIFLLVICRDYN